MTPKQPTPVFLPALVHLMCPYPQKALDLYFAARWLKESPRQALLQAQSQCRQQPQEPIPEEQDRLMEHRLHHLSEQSGAWMQHPKLGLLPPVMAVSIAARHETVREVSAQREFQKALIKELEASKVIPRQIQIDPFVIWHAFVKEREREPGYEALERLQAEKEITEFILGTGEPGAQTAAYSIVTVAETKFKEQELSSTPAE